MKMAGENGPMGDVFVYCADNRQRKGLDPERVCAMLQLKGCERSRYPLVCGGIMAVNHRTGHEHRALGQSISL